MWHSKFLWDNFDFSTTVIFLAWQLCNNCNFYFLYFVVRSMIFYLNAILFLRGLLESPFPSHCLDPFRDQFDSFSFIGRILCGLLFCMKKKKSLHWISKSKRLKNWKFERNSFLGGKIILKMKKKWNYFWCRCLKSNYLPYAN